MVYRQDVWKYLRVLAIATIAIVTAGQAAAQNTGTIAGTVTDGETGGPLATVQIFLQGTQFGSLSTSTGTFTLNNIPPGTYTVIAQRIGYTEARQTGVTVSAGESTR
jgi:hypothetical protein